MTTTLRLGPDDHSENPANEALLGRVAFAVITGVLATLLSTQVQDRFSPPPASPPPTALAEPAEPVATVDREPAPVDHTPLTRPELRRLQLEVLAGLQDLLQAPPAVYVAQVHAESRHDCDAQSGVGAVGCGQFLEGAWQDVAGDLPAGCRPLAMRTDPECSFIANALYLRLAKRYARIPNAGPDLGLHAYNAGAGWTRKESAAAAAAGLDPTSYEKGLRLVCLRRASACRESEGYVGNILRRGGYADQVKSGAIPVAPPSLRTRRSLSFGVDSSGQVSASLDFSF